MVLIVPGHHSTKLLCPVSSQVDKGVVVNWKPIPFLEGVCSALGIRVGVDNTCTWSGPVCLHLQFVHSQADTEWVIGSLEKNGVTESERSS